MATLQDPLAGNKASNKRVSKIPKRTPTPRGSQLSQQSLDSSTSKSGSTDSSMQRNLPRIFETKNLNSACDFLHQLKNKLQNDINGQKNNVNQGRVSGIVNNLLENDKNQSDQKVSGIVSSILDTLKDVSENLTPMMSLTDQNEAAGKLLELNRTSSLLSQTEKYFYMAQQFTVSHLQQDATGTPDSQSEKANQEKLVIDKQLLHQLADLHVLLKDTITKLVDKGTFTQEDEMKSLEFQTSETISKTPAKGKFGKRFGKTKRQASPSEPQVQVDHEAKPPQTTDNLQIPQVKRLLEILQSPEVRPLLELDGPTEQEGTAMTPPNTEVTKTDSVLEPEASFVFSPTDDVTSPELSDDDEYPIEYKCCLCDTDEEKKDKPPDRLTLNKRVEPTDKPARSGQETPPIIPPPQSFSETDTKEKPQSPRSPLRTSTRSSIKMSPSQSPILYPPTVDGQPFGSIPPSPIGSKTSTRLNPIKQADAAKEAKDPIMDDIKKPLKQQKGKDKDKKDKYGKKEIKETRSVVPDPSTEIAKSSSKKGVKDSTSPKQPKGKDVPKKSCTASCAPLKSLEKSLRRSLEKSIDKSLDTCLDKEVSKKSSIKNKFSFSRKKSNVEDQPKKQKGKEEKSKKWGKDGGNKAKKAKSKEEVTPDVRSEIEESPERIAVPVYTSSIMFQLNAEMISKVTSGDIEYQNISPIIGPVTQFDQDTTIPPPPTFDYDSYFNVEPANEDSLLSLIRLHSETGRNQIMNPLTASTALKREVSMYGAETRKTRLEQITYSLGLVNIFQVSSNPALRENENLELSFDTTEKASNLIEVGDDTVRGDSELAPILLHPEASPAQHASTIPDVDSKPPATSDGQNIVNYATQELSDPILDTSVSNQEYLFGAQRAHLGTGSAVLRADVDQSTNHSPVQQNYSVQAVPPPEDAQGALESWGTVVPGKSLETIKYRSRSASVALPKTKSKITQVAYQDSPIVHETPKIETTSTEMTAAPSLTDTRVGEDEQLSDSDAQLEYRRIFPRLSDPSVAKLRCRDCMCVIGGAPIERTDKGIGIEGIDKLEELEFLHKDSPPRYFEQVIQEIDMMRNCIEFAMDHQLSVHDKIKAYLDDGRVVKSKYPHFHTVIDGVPIILLWKEDPGYLFKHLKKRRSKVSRKAYGKSSSIAEKAPAGGDPRNSSEKNKSIHKTKLLLDHLANTMAKCRGRRKYAYRCDECGVRCPGKYNKLTHTCETTSTSSLRAKSSSPTDPGHRARRKSTSPGSRSTSPYVPKNIAKPDLKKGPEEGDVIGCKCDDDFEEVEPSSKSRRASKTRSLPKFKDCKRPRKSPFCSTDEDECCDRPKCANPYKKSKEKVPKNKSTNVPSKTDNKSIQTYYLTAKAPQLPKQTVPPSSKPAGDSESDNDIPYLIDVNSLPQFEHPETVCSSKLFDVKQIDCELRDEIKTGNRQVKDTLLRINLNALLDSFRPAKCCKKMVINGRTRSTYPYPASLQSLPLSEEDLDRILEIIQSNNQKRFDTVKRLYDEPAFNFQTATEQRRPQQVYFFELFKKADCKVSSATTSTSSTSSRSIVPQTTVRHDLKIFEFIRRIYTSHPISEKRVPKKKKDSTKTLYRHHSKHRRHKKHRRSRRHSKHHHAPKPKQRNRSTSMVHLPISSKQLSSMSLLNKNKPVRNISFLLIPKSELNNYFCGELSSMYSPSLNSLPFDDSDHQTTPSNNQLISKDLSLINEEEPEDYALTPTEYARTLGAIYELDESDKDYPTRDVSKEVPCSVSAHSMQSTVPSNQMTNFEVMTCRLSSTTNNPSKDILEDIRTNTEFETISTNSSTSTTQFPDIPLQRKSIDSDLSVRKHSIFSSSSILSERSSSKIPISCLPLSCSIGKDNKSNFLHLPNILTDTKRFLHRQKEEVFKPNLDKIVEKSSETTSTTLSTPMSQKRKGKSLKRSSCSLSLNATASRIEKQTSTPDNLSLNSEQLVRVVSSNKSDLKKEFRGYDLPMTFEMMPQNEMRTKRTMKIDKAVVAYAISPSSEFTFLSEEGTSPRDHHERFKSENICAWPVFQNRATKKKNSAFVVAIHSSAVRMGTKEPHQFGDQPNHHDDYCEICRKKRNLSTDSFILGYIGENGRATMESKSEPQQQHHNSAKREKKERYEEKEKGERAEKREVKVEKERRERTEKSFRLDKKSSRKDSVGSVKTRSSKVVRRKGSKKIVPEVIDIKVPTHVKSTRLKHKFCNDGDRPGYVTVLSTPCNCPDVTIFIPCYCTKCECKKSNKHCRHKASESDYAMVPIIERNEAP